MSRLAALMSDVWHGLTSCVSLCAYLTQHTRQLTAHRTSCPTRWSTPSPPSPSSTAGSPVTRFKVEPVIELSAQPEEREET